ncbi:hypothetical protein WN55_02908 [Dufourea novaeangliae]|uniref:Uncharacterized protein n=1 Tax=Dufourea novaeangliae TaxID=178035 RepID=A0A154PIC8_DUFNO|nr:hypothetical protein WN55_02908 [Dufourea novaeangliae]
MSDSCGGVTRQDTSRVVIHDIFVCEVNDRSLHISLTTAICPHAACRCPPVSLVGAELPTTALRNQYVYIYELERFNIPSKK